MAKKAELRGSTGSNKVGSKLVESLGYRGRVGGANIYFYKLKDLGNRDGSSVLPDDPDFFSWHPLCSSQTPVTPVLGDPTLPSGVFGHQACTGHTDIIKQNTHSHKRKELCMCLCTCAYIWSLL